MAPITCRCGQLTSTLTPTCPYCGESRGVIASRSLRRAWLLLPSLAGSLLVLGC